MGRGSKVKGFCKVPGCFEVSGFWEEVTGFWKVTNVPEGKAPTASSSRIHNVGPNKG